MTDKMISRRGLISAAAGSAAAAAAFPAFAASVDQKLPAKWTMTVDVAVLGAGGAGQHAQLAGAGDAGI